ncbi:MAG TPA: acyl carrier protein [Bacteroidales bacterium]|nr:acyl carrier protein [Bacteroidales bacterium]
MKKKDFYKELVDFLELDVADLDENTEFKSIDGYDSMAVMSLIAFCDEKFSTKINAQQIQKLTTVGSLMDFLGSEKFAD